MTADELAAVAAAYALVAQRAAPARPVRPSWRIAARLDPLAEAAAARPLRAGSLWRAAGRIA